MVPPCRLCERAFRNTDGPARNSTRDKKDQVIEELRETVRLLKRQVNDIRDNGFNINHLIEFQASRLLCHFAYCTLEEGVPRKMAKKLPKLPTDDAAFHALLSAEQSIVIKCTARLSFSRCVYRGNKSGTIRNSLQGAIREPVRMSQGARISATQYGRPAKKSNDACFVPWIPL
jgi:hypothetical protein